MDPELWESSGQPQIRQEGRQVLGRCWARVGEEPGQGQGILPRVSPYVPEAGGSQEAAGYSLPSTTEAPSS